jgi:hypothetical protein
MGSFSFSVLMRDNCENLKVSRPLDRKNIPFQWLKKKCGFSISKKLLAGKSVYIQGGPPWIRISHIFLFDHLNRVFIFFKERVPSKLNQRYRQFTSVPCARVINARTFPTIIWFIFNLKKNTIHCKIACIHDDTKG